MPVQIFTRTCGPLATNAYLCHETAANAVVVIDPAIGADELFERARQLVADGARFEGIWNTHGHFDHIYDNARWKAEFRAPIYAHPADDFFLEHLREQSLWFGLEAPEIVPTDVALSEGDTVPLGSESALVECYPGHSPGSVAFLLSNAASSSNNPAQSSREVVFRPRDVVLVGDVLFQGSVGRTDLPGGDARVLANSLERLFHLPDATRILPGHGPETTIGQEKADNEVARQLLASLS